MQAAYNTGKKHNFQPQSRTVGFRSTNDNSESSSNFNSEATSSQQSDVSGSESAASMDKKTAQRTGQNQRAMGSLYALMASKIWGFFYLFSRSFISIIASRTKYKLRPK